MKTVTSAFYNRLKSENTFIVGTTPHVVLNGVSAPVRVTPECGGLLLVKPYGGGTRWQCPVCDGGWWVNGPPPQDMTCRRPG